MDIKILGTGCPKCKKLEKNVMQAVQETGTNANIEKVTSVNNIMEYGVMMTPALVVNEKVVSTGKILQIESIKKILQNK